MSTQHTPGPWHIGMKPGPMIYGSDSSQVADLRGDLLDRGEAQANAALIAAAPDLLAALQWLLQHDPDGDGGAPDYKELRHICDTARAAIAKATGA
jgi:hypothetical protein